MRILFFFLLRVPWTLLLRAQDPQPAPTPTHLEILDHTDRLSVDDEPATLRIWNRDIVTFRTTVNENTPRERVAQLRDRLRSIPTFDLFYELEVSDLSYEGIQGYLFSVGGTGLFTLLATDMETVSRQTLERRVEEIQERLRELQKASQDQKKPDLLAKGIGLSILATLILLISLQILKKVNRVINHQIDARTRQAAWMKWKGFELRDYLVMGVTQFLNAVFLISKLLLAYLWLGFVLGRFPFTKPVADSIRNHFGVALLRLLENVLNAIPNILVVLVIFYVTRGAVRLAMGFSETMERTNDDDDETWLSRDSARATRSILCALIWVTGIMIAYPYIPGSGSEAFKGLGVLLGLMLSLGSSGTVNQVMSGFVILYSGGIRTGEYVLLGEVEGIVTDVKLLSTRVRTPKNEFVTVPNSVLLGKHSVNLSRHHQTSPTEVATAVTIGYDTPWRQVDAMLLKAAEKTRRIRKNPAPRVLKTDLSDWYIRYELRFIPAELEKKNQILSDLHVNILDIFNEHGVQVMSPHFVAQPEEGLVVEKENWAPHPAEPLRHLESD